jgi:hypothetical protein
MAEKEPKEQTAKGVKVLALQNCATSKGKLLHAFKADDREVWPGDIEELPAEEAAAFGPEYLRPQATSAKVRRWKNPEDRKQYGPKK